MPLTPAKCPECGGLVEVDNEKRAGLCQYCHQPFVIEDAIQTFNTYYSTNNITNHNYGNGAVVNVYENQNSVSALIERAFMFLEDGDFSRADEYCEKVLDIEPENARAYLGKLMANLQMRKESGFNDINVDFSSNNNYQKVMAFGDENIKELLIKNLDRIRIYKANLEKDLAERKRKSAEQRKIFEAANKEKFNITETELKIKREEIAKVQGLIQTERDYTLGLKSDGTVISTSPKFYKGPSVWEKLGKAYIFWGDYGEEYRDTIAIAGRIRLKADGTVNTVRDNAYWDWECDVSDWREIVAIAGTKGHVVGLKSDGTVVAVGKNENGCCNVFRWTDIVAISTTEKYTVGLKTNGKVVIAGTFSNRADVEKWSNIVAIAASDHHIVGLKYDGTVVASGHNGNGECNVWGWRDIVAISAEGFLFDCHTVGLKSDGTVVAIGSNRNDKCFVRNWKLFNDINNLETEQKIEREKRLEKEKQIEQANHRSWGRCQYCGGEFKGLLTKKCSRCGKLKDY